MPHIDEMLGVATLASAGLLAALALRPVDSGTAGGADAQVHTAVAIAAAMPGAAPIVCRPSVEPIARRSVESTRIEREQESARECATKDTVQPRA